MSKSNEALGFGQIWDMNGNTGPAVDSEISSSVDQDTKAGIAEITRLILAIDPETNVSNANYDSLVNMYLSLTK